MSAMNLKDPREIPAYTIAEASLYLGVPKSTLRSWFAGQNYLHNGERKRFVALIRPADPVGLGLSFSNLVEAYVLTSIRRKHNIRLQVVRTALKWLRDQFGSKRPLIEEQFATNGYELFVERLGEIINLSRPGQIEMVDLLRAYLDRIERDSSGLPIKLYPFMRSQPAREQPRSIVIDPRVSFGRPVISGTGIPTAVLAERYKAGDSYAELAKDYETSVEAIEDAIRCELDLKAA